MVPLVLFAASCFIGGGKIHIQKRQEATLTSLPSKGGKEGQMEGRTDIWKFPLCFTRHWSFGAAAQKRGMFSAHFFAMFHNLPDR